MKILKPSFGKFSVLFWEGGRLREMVAHEGSTVKTKSSLSN